MFGANLRTFWSYLKLRSTLLDTFWRVSEGGYATKFSQNVTRKQVNQPNCKWISHDKCYPISKLSFTRLVPYCLHTIITTLLLLPLYRCSSLHQIFSLLPSYNNNHHPPSSSPIPTFFSSPNCLVVGCARLAPPS